jgi:hypothetical protein
MWSPRWSPDGRFIAGQSAPGLSKVMLYDLQGGEADPAFQPGKRMPKLVVGWRIPVLFSRFEVWRVRMRDRKAEQITDLTRIKVAGWGWFATAPNNSLITARDAGTEEICALDWEAP